MLEALVSCVSDDALCKNIFIAETSCLDQIKLGKDLFDGRRHVVELRFMKNLILVRVNLHF